MNTRDLRHKPLLQSIARQAMLDRGLLPDFSAAAEGESERLDPPLMPPGGAARDLRDLPWVSIDNDDSLDLDQLTAARTGPGGGVNILVAVADVAASVTGGSALDDHARYNTTSVYTVALKFPMLPDRLSTDLTSLNVHEDRPAMVVEMTVDADGSVARAGIYGAWVRSKAKLAYSSAGPWLEGAGPMPAPLDGQAGLATNLQHQDAAAQRLKAFRHRQGALRLESIEPLAVFEGDRLHRLEVAKRNRSHELIEEFMIAANGATARYLESARLPAIRRVVHEPRRWDRIVEIAAERGFRLPAAPDQLALSEFLRQEQAADAETFPDLSLSVIKLLGPGEYVAEAPGAPAPGHFGLAVKAYTHSTAPNRRYSDLVIQRQLKAALAGAPPPYALSELRQLAARCTEKEDAADKVERQVRKSAAALLLSTRIGEEFEGIVTGAARKGTWVRLFSEPVEGRVVRGYEGMDVGHRVRVRLVSVEVEKGFIDFARAGGPRRRRR